MKDDAYLELQAALGHTPQEDIWEKLCDPGADWLTRPIAEIAGEYQKLDRLMEKAAERFSRKKKSSEDPPPVMLDADVVIDELTDEADPAAGRELALSELMAVEASGLEDVVSFRKDVLDERLLAPDEIEPWVTERAREEGQPTFILQSRQSLPEGHKLSFDGKTRVRLTPPVKLDELGVRELTYEVLWYLGAHEPWPRMVPVKEGGTLDRLRQVSDRLSTIYPWEAHQASTFVLTGKPPLVAMVTATPKIDLKNPARSRIEMKIDPAARPEQVMKVYREARARIASGDRIRTQSIKHLRLAVFLAQSPDGESWEERMRRWNERFPKEKYKNVSDFKRDCLRSQERLTSPKYRKVPT